MLEVAIKSILEEIVTPIIGDNKVYPIFGTEIPCIVYTDIPAGGTVIKEDQVEIKVIHKDYDEALMVRKAILDKLNMEQNKPSLEVGNIVFRSQLSGGGSLFNDSIQVWELSIILVINWRCKE